jgi:hypothetical protein
MLVKSFGVAMFVFRPVFQQLYVRGMPINMEKWGEKAKGDETSQTDMVITVSAWPTEVKNKYCRRILLQNQKCDL